MILLAAALVACKAVYSPVEARGCPGLETDLSLKDGRFVMAHGPEIPADALDLDAFVEKLPPMKMVNLDFKDRTARPGETAMTRALLAHLPALEKLAKKGGLVVYSSAVPTRYWELRKFLKSHAVGVPGFEVADYTAERSASWGLKLTWWQRLVLPPFRLYSAWYARRAGAPWLIVQEETAASWKGPGPLMCWTRDAVKGPAPQACVWTQRTREGKPSSRGTR